MSPIGTPFRVMMDRGVVSEIIDDFERGNLNPYTEANASVWSASSANPESGTYHARYGQDDSGSSILSTSGLPNYPEQGDEFEFHVYFGPFNGRGGYTSLFWGVQSEGVQFPSSNWLVSSFDAGEIELRTYDGSTITTLDQITGEAPRNQYVTIAVGWGNPRMNVAGYDANGDLQFNVDGDTTAWTSGGIGYRNNGPDSSDIHTVDVDTVQERQVGTNILWWDNHISKSASNPLIMPSDNPDAENEQYTPSPVIDPDGGYYLWVKSDELNSGNNMVLRLWTSSDGVSWSRASTAFGPSDSNMSIDGPREPFGLYDPGASTHYLWYRGNRDSAQDDIGVATGSDPTALSDSADNPILTSTDFENAFGHSSGAVDAPSITDVVIENGTAHYFGRYTTGGTDYLWRGTSTGFSDTSISLDEQFLARDPYRQARVVQAPSVVNIGGTYYCPIGAGSGTGAKSRQVYSLIGNSLTSLEPKAGVMIPCEDNAWDQKRADWGQWLKENDGVNLTPATVNGNHRYYYSGQETDGGVRGVGLVTVSDFPQ